jgi:hypothetical protein
MAEDRLAMTKSLFSIIPQKCLFRKISKGAIEFSLTKICTNMSINIIEKTAENHVGLPSVTVKRLAFSIRNTM